MKILNSDDSIIYISDIEEDQDYNGLKIVDVNDTRNEEYLKKRRFEFQQSEYNGTKVRCMVCRQGNVSDKARRRIVAYPHVNLKLFTKMVKYDPSNPPPDDYHAKQMSDHHKRTQADFGGAKATNKVQFRDYILEGLREDRTVYLPLISGWQTKPLLKDTIFVCFDRENPNCLYGELYLPDAPIMQSDGQTQTAALFAIAKSKEAVDKGALEHLHVSLEIELGIEEQEAAQSFADRNGRGVKKNLNLVIEMDSSSPLSRLRNESIKGTIFEDRIAGGKDTRTSGENNTEFIIDLSTCEQILLTLISDNKLKHASIKHFHIDTFIEDCRNFFLICDEIFGPHWEKNPVTKEPFRKIYTHGWAFCLKGIAQAYYECVRTKNDLIADVIREINSGSIHLDPSIKQKESFNFILNQHTEINDISNNKITIEELKTRLLKIKWERHKKHWLELTGSKRDNKTNKVKFRKLKGFEKKMAIGMAQNNQTFIKNVSSAILSDDWNKLCSNIDLSE